MRSLKKKKLFVYLHMLNVLHVETYRPMFEATWTHVCLSRVGWSLPLTYA